MSFGPEDPIFEPDHEEHDSLDEFEKMIDDEVDHNYDSSDEDKSDPDEDKSDTDG